MHNLTKKQIAESIECCVKADCKGCPLYYYKDFTNDCEKHIIGILRDDNVRLKEEVERLQKKREAKCGTCYYSKPVPFGKSKCYVECTNQEHIEKYCRYRKISLKRQRTTPACKSYKEMAGDSDA